VDEAIRSLNDATHHVPMSNYKNKERHNALDQAGFKSVREDTNFSYVLSSNAKCLSKNKQVKDK